MRVVIIPTTRKTPSTSDVFRHRRRWPSVGMVVGISALGGICNPFVIEGFSYERRRCKNALVSLGCVRKTHHCATLEETDFSDNTWRCFRFLKEFQEQDLWRGAHVFRVTYFQTGGKLFLRVIFSEFSSVQVSLVLLFAVKHNIYCLFRLNAEKMGMLMCDVWNIAWLIDRNVCNGAYN